MQQSSSEPTPTRGGQAGSSTGRVTGGGRSSEPLAFSFPVCWRSSSVKLDTSCLLSFGEAK